MSLQITENECYISSGSPSDTAIILLQMGGPYNLDKIPEFLIQLFSDKDLIRLPFFIKPFQNVIARIVSKKRTPYVHKLYEQIGGGSPILLHTAKLAKAMSNILLSLELNIDITFIMRYSDPRVNEIVKKLKERNIKNIILFPLYPHFSLSTSGSSFNDFYESIKKDKTNLNVIEFKDWGTEEFYLNWWRKNLFSILENEIRQENYEKTFVLFSAHGLPEKYVKNGDPYQTSLKNSTSLIMKDVKFVDWDLSFQSRVGPQKWLTPYTIEILEEIANKGKEYLIFVPIGFVSDHLETLQEIDILYTGMAKSYGIREVMRVSVPNSSKVFAEGIVNYIVKQQGLMNNGK